jgi:hypothetical protein
MSNVAAPKIRHCFKRNDALWAFLFACRNNKSPKNVFSAANLIKLFLPRNALAVIP